MPPCLIFITAIFLAISSFAVVDVVVAAMGCCVVSGVGGVGRLPTHCSPSSSSDWILTTGILIGVTVETGGGAGGGCCLCRILAAWLPDGKI